MCRTSTISDIQTEEQHEHFDNEGYSGVVSVVDFRTDTLRLK